MKDKIIQLKDNEGNNVSPLIALEAVLDIDGRNVKTVIKDEVETKLEGKLDDIYTKEEVNKLVEGLNDSNDDNNGSVSLVNDTITYITNGETYTISKSKTEGIDINHNNNVLATFRNDVIRTNVPVSFNYNNYATETYVDAKLNDLVGLAPEALDTIKELSDAIGNDENFAATITNNLATKANKDEVYTKTQSDAKYVAKDDIVVSQANGRMKIVAIGSKYNTVLPITETGVYAIEIIKGDGTRHTSTLTISNLGTNATCDVRLYSNIYIQVRYKSGEKGIQLDAAVSGGSYLAATKIIDIPEWVV